MVLRFVWNWLRTVALAQFGYKVPMETLLVRRLGVIECMRPIIVVPPVVHMGLLGIGVRFVRSVIVMTCLLLYCCSVGILVISLKIMLLRPMFTVW